MTYAPEGSKEELRSSKRQLATVIDLNKCLGCQTCVVACKNLWTNEEGKQHMRWMNVTTYPGRGYPRDCEQKGGGFRDGHAVPGRRPTLTDFGDVLNFNNNEVHYGGKGQTVHLKPTNSAGKDPDWGYNWDEDQGGGQWPNPFFFNFPKMCNHCTNPACLAACPRNAIYKREQDGIVLVDQERCRGYGFCIEACPYGMVIPNTVTKKSEKCILCFPRIEKGIAPACSRQCVGRTRAFGFLDDETSQVYKLVRKWQVALPLHPEYGTSPNVYYVPPLSPLTLDPSEGVTDEMRIPLKVLEGLFGPEVKRSLDTIVAEREKKRAGQESELVDILISREWKSRFAEFTNSPAAS